MDKPWWRLERYGHDLAPALQQLFSYSSSYHNRRLANASAAMWAYERDLYNFDDYPSEVVQAFPHWGDGWYKKSPKSNEIKKTVDAATAWLFADQPRIEVRANGVPFEMRRVLEERSLALDQTIDSTSARIAAMDVGRDGWLTGFGCWRPVQYEGRIEYRRLQAHQCWWDPVDAADGKPWMFACIERWDRQALQAWYRDISPEYLGITKSKRDAKLKAVDDITAVGGDWFYGSDGYMPPYEWSLRSDGVWANVSDQVLVVHMWRRSTTADEDKADGRYVMLVSGQKGNQGSVLVDAKYGRRDLPVVWWSPYPAPSGGLTGLGLAHTLMGHQQGMDRSNHKTQQHLDELGMSKILVDPSNNSHDDKAKAAIAEKHGIAFIEVAGLVAPQIYQPQALRMDHLQYVDILRRRVQEDSGLGQIIVQGSSQLGPQASGIAIAEEANRQTDRVSDVYERWSAMRLATGERTIEVIEDALATDRDFEASFMDEDGSWRRMPWSKLHRLNEQYQVSLEPAGALGRSRAGRLQKALELSAQGLLPPEITKRLLLDSPDLRQANRAVMAGEDRINKMLAELSAEDGDHEQAVDDDLNLPLALQRVGQAIDSAHVAGAKPETIKRLRSFKLDVAKRLEAEAKKNAPPPPPMPGAPMGPAPMDPGTEGLPTGGPVML